MEEKEGCCCSGIRFCGRCIDSDRVQAIIGHKVALLKTSDVVSRQYGTERTSSCSFTCVGSSQYGLCWQCNTVFQIYDGAFKSCVDHEYATPNLGICLEGIFVIPDFVSALEEESFVRFLDEPSSFSGWKLSQSGRRKQNFGPRANFKKRKLNTSGLLGMPKQLESVMKKVQLVVRKLTMKDYHIAEVSALEYTDAMKSSIDPHVDDTWLWGDRIGGLNLLEDTVMTFVNSNGVAVDVFLPCRAFFLLSNRSRYDWLHGIRWENIKNRRISFTFRELSDNLDVDQEIIQNVMERTSVFV
ncbi:alkylated DNA repair protein alkB like protein 4 [Trypanosoma rangeli]|uniref:Alkylated DNA repair protein alkB like protein 4 n=1 Tax=Trypanosoma rangeli TaxID=5698 RepID=A0A422N9C6_TRYRA|nr:alkylated DNA repair protein alkB like protein 4 [Trypanosoma rangeli]RNF02043.1 alkylated DNA repair protein alkB like protein 4 [Trypanosoma rangeli]|eukprot:RNF02043.1 alkylated DNA repair protein alkB like protein 4 [Trypanosoma rangeli]